MLSALLIASLAVFHYRIDKINYQCAVLEHIVMTDHIRDADKVFSYILLFKKNIRKTKDVRLIKKLSKLTVLLKRRVVFLNKQEFYPEISSSYIFFNNSNRSNSHTNTAMLESMSSIWALYSKKIAKITSNKRRISKVNTIKRAVKYGRAYQKKLRTLNNRIVVNSMVVEEASIKVRQKANTVFFILLALVLAFVFRKKIPLRLKLKLNKIRLASILSYIKGIKRSIPEKNKLSKRAAGKLYVDEDESMAKEFVECSISDLKKLPMLLKKNRKSESTLKGFLEHTCRTIHKIKGDAAMLNFHEVAELLHDYEDRLIPMKNKARLTKLDLTDFLSMNKRVIVSLKKISAVMKHIDRYDYASRAASTSQLFKRLQFYTNEISQANKKKVRLVDEGFTQDDIPKKSRKDILSIVVQLLRNAVKHGIEDSEKRMSANKPAYGSIYIGLQKQKDSFTVTVRDDGAGFDFNKIKKVAIKSGKYTQTQIDECTTNQLITLVLQSGFSTVTNVNKHAGRGVGLNLVDTTVKDLGGKLSIRMRPGEFIEFAMTFPY